MYRFSRNNSCVSKSNAEVQYDIVLSKRKQYHAIQKTESVLSCLLCQ